MAQAVSYGSITIIDTNDIESITIEYARNKSTSTPPDKDTGGWSTTRPAWAQSYYIWQRARIHKSGTDSSDDTFGAAVCLTGSTGQSGAPGQSLTSTKTQYTNAASDVTITKDNHTSYTWTDNIPEYNASKPAYWGRITNTYSNPSKTEYLFYKDNGITKAVAESIEANNNSLEALSISIDAQGNSQGALSIARATEQHYWFNSKTEGTLEAGAYITDTPIDTFKNGKAGGYLLTRSDGLELGKGTNKFMTLSGSELDFYRPGTTTIDAKLSSTGLNITNGSITLGNNFSVNSMGSMIAKDGQIGGWSINSDSLYSLNKIEWDEDTNGIFMGNHDEDNYFLTEDTTVVSKKTYYSYNKETKEFTAVSNPTGNPKTKEYYEKETQSIFTISGGKIQYVKTDDITVNPNSDYYTYDETTGIYEKIENPTGNPSAEGWYKSLGPMWYINSDGSASFGSLLVNQSGSLNVPAASISGKLTADQIEVNDLGAISANIGSTINSETTSNNFEVNSEKKVIYTTDDIIINKKEYIKLINELEDYHTGQDYLLETDDTASYILEGVPTDNATLEATFYCNTTEEGATEIFYYGTEGEYTFDGTDGLIWIEYDGQKTFTIHDGFDGTRLINVIYNVVPTVGTSLQEIVEESFIKLNTQKSIYKLTADSTRTPEKIYYEFNPDYSLTNDESVIENTRYYTQQIDGSGNINYFLVNNPSNPKENNYYELHPKYKVNNDNSIVNPSNSNLYETESTYSAGIILQEGSVSILSNEEIVAETDETNNTLNLYDIELIGQMDVGNLRIMSYDNGLVVTIGD